MDGQTKTKPSGLKEWKPEQGAGYYVVGADGHIEAHVWQGHEHDLQTWSFGNCFQMYEEAAYAREKMQELFLQFHEDHGFRYSGNPIEGSCQEGELKIGGLCSNGTDMCCNAYAFGCYTNT